MIITYISNRTRRFACIHSVLKSVYQLIRKANEKILRAALCIRPLRPLQASHELNGELIVSLTSFPARFDTLHLTLKSLLGQSIHPDKVILWIAFSDADLLPQKVIELKKWGLEINYCLDIRSYKKIIPVLDKYPHSYVVTADDDVYYWRNWLKELVDGYLHSEANVVCHRAHKIVLQGGGLPALYSDWSHLIGSTVVSPLLFPTGLGGVLYAPGVFHQDVGNKILFFDLCYTTDDVWLYWMHRMNNSVIKVLGTTRYTL